MNQTNTKTVNFTQYFYGKSCRKGVIVARVFPDGTFQLGWSLAAKNRGDRFNAQVALELATARRDMATKYAWDDAYATTYYRGLVPSSMHKLLNVVLERVARIVNKPNKVEAETPTKPDWTQWAKVEKDENGYYFRYLSLSGKYEWNPITDAWQYPNSSIGWSISRLDTEPGPSIPPADHVVVFERSPVTVEKSTNLGDILASMKGKLPYPFSKWGSRVKA